MVGRDSSGPKSGESLEVEGRDPHVVQVGTIREFLPGAASPPIKQDPDEGLHQWETQWQELMKTMQPPLSGQESHRSNQAWLEEDAQDFPVSFKGVACARRRPDRASADQILPGLPEEAQEGFIFSVRVKGEIPDDEEDNLETQRQRFRQFRYQEAKSPREVCGQLWELCHQWLKPDQHTKERIVELLILEQFVVILPREMQSFVRKRHPETCTEAVALVEDFLIRRSEDEKQEEILGPVEEMAVHSPKSEQDLSVVVNTHFSMEIKSEGDVEESILGTDEHLGKGTFELEQPEEGEVSKVLLRRPKGTFSQAAEKSGIQQGSESHPDSCVRKMTKQNFLRRDGAGGFCRTAFQEEIRKGQPQLIVADHHQDSVLKIQETPNNEKLSTCTYCGENFANTSHLITHLITQKGQKSCELSNGKPRLRQRIHVNSCEKANVGNGLYSCSDCGKSFSDPSCLRKHQLIHTGEKPYSCSQCGKNFSECSVLWRHKQSHTGEKPHTHADRGKGFCDKNSLSAHQRAPMGEKPLERSESSKRFGCALNLARHKKLRMGGKSYQCSECGKRFPDKKSLVTHKRTHTGEKLYTCSECGRNFRWKGSLLAHVKTHTEKRPHQCSDCGKSFCEKHSLITHRRAHTGEKPYVCLKCGKRFGYSPNLARHQKLHTGEKPYQCPQCGKWFSQSSNLQRHKRIHTKEKPHKCTQCDKSFSQKTSLIGHQRTHMREKPFECSECEKSFCSFSGLRKHLRIHTGIKL